jgi:2-dehydro-3-deoxyphosphooctonate aldolase (KDO 8-P synthase)
VLAAIKARYGIAILTDIHEPSQAAPAAEVADVLQIPAFLSRQTDLIVAAAKTGRAVNIKKGQFLAPDDVRHAVAKAVDAGNTRVFVTERGTSFGYHNLVVDMRAFPMLRELGVPVVFDVTHSLQLPGGGDGVTAGQAQYIEPLASAGVAAGVDGVFLEVHDQPERAKSDAQPAAGDRCRRQARGHTHHGDTGSWLIAPSPAKCSTPKRPRFSRSSIEWTSASIARSICCCSAAAG